MNNKGIVLLITLIVVALVMILGSVAFYISQTATKTTGVYKQFNMGLQTINAAYEETKYIVNYTKANGAVPSSSALDCKVQNSNFTTKIFTPTSSGSSVWAGDAQNPDTVTTSPDIVCSIDGFKVYVKLINTSLGNTAIGRRKHLNAGGVTLGKQGTGVTPLTVVPYLYDFIIEARRIGSPNDTVSAMALYGY